MTDRESLCVRMPSSFQTEESISASLQSDFVGFCHRKSSETASGVKISPGTVALKYSKCCYVFVSHGCMNGVLFCSSQNPL